MEKYTPVRTPEMTCHDQQQHHSDTDQLLTLQSASVVGFDVDSILKCHMMIVVYAEQAAQQQHADPAGQLVLGCETGMIF